MFKTDIFLKYHKFKNKSVRSMLMTRIIMTTTSMIMVIIIIIIIIIITVHVNLCKFRSDLTTKITVMTL
jgi:hypothetical protein